MRINSGTLGMDSARHFTSSSRVSTSTASVVVGSLTTGGQSLTQFGRYFSEQNPKEKENEENLSRYRTSRDLLSDALSEEGEVASDARNILSSSTRLRLENISRRDDAKSSFQKLHALMIHNILKLILNGKNGSKEKVEDLTDEANAFTNEGSGFLIKTESTTNIYYEETEETSFCAKGLVKTDDGREININLDIYMSRSFRSVYSENISTLKASYIDPLVVNLSDAPCEIGDMKFYFDLDCDGKEEEISTLGAGSAFLALDKNNDGIINDGSELFGTRSGDGFRDLAAYDEDGNGWIDEADSIFSKLRIWVKDSNGNDALYSLAEKGIGAIALASAATDFSLHSQNSDSENAAIRRTGIFLYENGNVGTLQHVDFVS